MRPLLRNLLTNQELAPDGVPLDVREWRESLWTGGPSGMVGYSGKGIQGFRVELLFDGFVDGDRPTDVRPKVAALQELGEVSRGTYAPPPCLFTWGAYRLPVVLRDLKLEYSRFGKEGSPTRALAVLILGIMDEDSGRRAAVAAVGVPLGAAKLASDARTMARVAGDITLDAKRIAESAVLDVRTRGTEIGAALLKEGERVARDAVRPLAEISAALKEKIDEGLASLNKQIQRHLGELESAAENVKSEVRKRLDTALGAVRDGIENFDGSRGNLSALETKLKTAALEAIKTDMHKIGVVLRDMDPEAFSTGDAATRDWYAAKALGLFEIKDFAARSKAEMEKTILVAALTRHSSLVKEELRHAKAKYEETFRRLKMSLNELQGRGQSLEADLGDALGRVEQQWKRRLQATLMQAERGGLPAAVRELTTRLEAEANIWRDRAQRVIDESGKLIEELGGLPKNLAPKAG